MSRRALVVDDDTVSRLVLSHLLRTQDWEVEQAGDVPEAAALLRQGSYDLVVSDFHLPSGTGVDVLREAERAVTLPAFVLVTGIIEFTSLPAELTARVGAHLTKPVSSTSLRETLRRLVPLVGVRNPGPPGPAQSSGS